MGFTQLRAHDLRGATPAPAYGHHRDIGRFGPVIFHATIEQIAKKYSDDPAMVTAATRLWDFVAIGASMEHLDLPTALDQAKLGEPEIADSLHVLLEQIGKNFMASMIPAIRQINSFPDESFGHTCADILALLASLNQKKPSDAS